MVPLLRPSAETTGTTYPGNIEQSKHDVDHTFKNCPKKTKYKDHLMIPQFFQLSLSRYA